VEGPALVRRYLDAMVGHEWDELAATMTVDVVRRGPFQDDYHGRDVYVEFLRATFGWMQDYEMGVDRVWGDRDRVCAELAETVTIDGHRLRTEEAIVFELTDGLIATVSVYLRQSTTIP